MRSILITALLAITATVHAQEATQLSLEDAVKYALKHNADVKNARLDVKIQKAKNAQITSAAFPQVNGKGEITKFTDNLETFLPASFIGGPPGTFVPAAFAPSTTSSISVTGTQLLFDGAVLVALQAKRSVVALFQQTEMVTEENVRMNVQKAYYGLVIAQRQFGTLKSSLAFARKMAGDMQVMRDNGLIEKIDVDRTNVQVNNFAADSAKIALLLGVSEQMLKFQMGMDIDQPVVLTNTDLEGELSDVISLSDETADYSNRTEFSLVNTQLKLMRYDLKRYKLGALPSLAAFANAGYNYGSNNISDIIGNQYASSSLVGLQLNIPVFSGGRHAALVKEAKLNVRKTENTLEKTKQAIDFQTGMARTILKNSMLALQSQKRNMVLSESVLYLAQEKYKAGVGSNLEVTTAQTEMLRAQSNYYQSLLEVMNAKTDLQKALGQLK
jgi:outer membrane protein